MIDKDGNTIPIDYEYHNRRIALPPYKGMPVIFTGDNWALTSSDLHLMHYYRDTQDAIDAGFNVNGIPKWEKRVALDENGLEDDFIYLTEIDVYPEKENQKLKDHIWETYWSHYCK